MKDDRNQVDSARVSQASHQMASGKIHREQWPWYMTIAALQQYMEIAGYRGPLEDTNPDFNAAEEELGAHCVAAHPVDQASSHDDKYRTGRVAVGKRGYRTRLEFNVRPAPRAEGDKPQLIGVRDKDGGRTPSWRQRNPGGKNRRGSQHNRNMRKG